MCPFSRGLLLLLPVAAVSAQALRYADVPLSVGPAAFDPIRGTILHLAPGCLRELVGNTWRSIPTASPARTFGFLHASMRQRRLIAIAHGGNARYDFETWAFDGGSWWQIWSPTPSPRRGPQIAWDTIRDEAVLFGGIDQSSGPLADTWVFDGAHWQQRQPVTSPPPVVDGAMAYDLGRLRMVLADGGVAGGALRTFEWNGVDWAQVMTPTQPPARARCGLAYDIARRRTVLVGGFGNGRPLVDCWEYDGSDWFAVAPFPGLPRHGARLVYDQVGRRTLLFGGEAGGLQPRLDGWAWDGTSWSPAPPVGVGPEARIGETVAVEPSGNSVMLAGGSWVEPGSRDETWRWDGQQWTQLPIASPRGNDMAMWAQNGQMFLFGGVEYTSVGGLTVAMFGHRLSRLTNGGWVAVTTPVAPAPRAWVGFAFDSLRNHAMVFGGGDHATVFRDFWAFDGNTWRSHSVANGPSARASARMAHDPRRDRVVLFGGSDFRNQWQDTWEWDGTAWARVITTNQPLAGPMVYDPANQRVAMLHVDPTGDRTGSLSLFDGQRWTSSPIDVTSAASLGVGAVLAFRGELLAVSLGRMQRYLPQPSLVEAFGAPCGADAAQLSANAWPDLGERGFGLELHGARANSIAAVAGSTVAVAQPVLGCTLLADPTQLLVFALTSVSGRTEVSMPVPVQPGLIGAQVFFQAASQSGSAPHGVAMSRGLRIVIGR